jgi:hypothetical protein
LALAAAPLLSTAAMAQTRSAWSGAASRGTAAVQALDSQPVFTEYTEPVVADNFSSEIYRFARQEGPPAPQQPLDIAPAPTPTQPLDLPSPSAAVGSSANLLDPFGGSEFGRQLSPGGADAAQPITTPGGVTLSGSLAVGQASTAPGQLLTETTAVTTVTARRRTPVSQEPSIRGYQTNDIYSQSDGALFLPVRQDLDTLLSKIEPSLIQTIDILPGPYGLRYGPGFAFLNVVTVATPRYENGSEVHNRFGMTYRPNGDQWYGRDTVYGGSSDWGYIFNYGNRLGVDYDAGNGLNIPSSYHNQDFWDSWAGT